MTRRLAGKTAIVTGGAQGVGAAIARALAQEGSRVVVSDINETGASGVADSINTECAAGTATSIRLDVTSEADWIAAMAHCQTAMGGLSVLVNNAGIAPVATIEDLSLEEWRRVMAINVDSAFLGIKHAIPLLRESQPAAIVNIASISAVIASHNLTSYNASKAALLMLSRSAALLCARRGWDIRSNSILPTFVRTALLDELAGTGEEAMAKLIRQVPTRRLGEVEDVANAAVYLASDESRMMTASEIKLDGGMSAT